MNYLQKMTQHQLSLLDMMIKTNEWEIFKEYVKELVIAYLNTAESKDFLRGLKFAVTKFEEDLERI